MIEILISTAVLSGAIYLVSGTMADLVRGLRSTDQESIAVNLNNTLTTMIQDPDAWTQTIAKNNVAGKTGSAFACWDDDKNGCTNSKGGSFTPYAADGRLYQESYNPAASPKQGFSLQGGVCTTFDPTKPDPNCPMRIEFVARPICPTSGDCFKPEFLVDVQFQFAFAKGVQPPTWAQPKKLNRTVRMRGQSTPIQLSSTSPTTCPSGTLVVSIDPTTGMVKCSTKTATCLLYGVGSNCKKM